MEPITAIKLAEELFKIHIHAITEAYTNSEQVVYKEADIITLLQKLGLPKPDFDGYNKQVEREFLSPPGETIKETLDERKINLHTFQKMLVDISGRFWNNTVNVIDLISGELKIDDSIAEDLERVLGIDKQFWLNREKLYREKLEKLK